MSADAARQKLTQLCEGVTAGECGAVFPEPYIPFIPGKWNGVLVLAEAQNLAASNDGYVALLRRMSRRDRIERLYRAVETEKRVRIQPWDDGSLPLAVEAALGISPNETGVSNAVMWSQRNPDGTNRNPSDALQRLSSRLWEQMLGVLNPGLVVTAGTIAREVVRPVWPVEKQLNLRLPSPLAMAILAGSVDETALCSAQNVIRRLTEKYPQWFEKNRRFKALYVWHAMDRARKRHCV